uniref:Uncharacterized protein n=1 Tax=Meloidogyne enterolobii TaxID=390850 RepID=A0A6V7X7C1_MELEN|nr:unnamed protein product [Meloidogyne enterolobii]
MIKGSKTRAFFQRLNPLEETNETDLGSLDDVDLSKEVPTPKSFRLDLKSKRIKDENIKNRAFSANNFSTNRDISLNKDVIRWL